MRISECECCIHPLYSAAPSSTYTIPGRQGVLNRTRECCTRRTADSTWPNRSVQRTYPPRCGVLFGQTTGQPTICTASGAYLSPDLSGSSPYPWYGISDNARMVPALVRSRDPRPHPPSRRRSLVGHRTAPTRALGPVRAPRRSITMSRRQFVQTVDVGTATASLADCTDSVGISGGTSAVANGDDPDIS